MGKILSTNSHPFEGLEEFVNNGLILQNVEIPQELIENILFYVDVKTLLNCRRVCKCWNEIITDYIWRKKAEVKIGRTFTSDSIFEWKDFYLLCSDLFGRNLMDNHSGKVKFKRWQITHNHGDKWSIECPPIGSPALPKEPEFGNTQHCFVTSYGNCYKFYIIDLIKEGFTENILDHLQPPIEVSFIGIYFLYFFMHFFCCLFNQIYIFF